MSKLAEMRPSTEEVQSFPEGWAEHYKRLIGQLGLEQQADENEGETDD